ncbi:helix-turn-helix domain-containing protein [Mailhella massiliensis]
MKKSGGKLGGEYGAASLLGINRSTLQHRMKKLGICTTEKQMDEPPSLM